MDGIQAQFVQVLQERAGLDQATAERVAQVAIEFAQEQGPELVAQYAPEPYKSMVGGGGAGGLGGLGGVLGGLNKS
jgi:hypothetical protein